ncbi:MAG: TIM barrel protein, partial [Novosphingobium sp.]
MPHLLPPAFISVAAEAGYQGVSVRLIPASPLTERQLPMFGSSPLLAETIARMNATGVYINDIEVLKIEARVDMSELERVLETGARLQARNLVVIVADDDELRIADSLGSVAELSAAYGLRTCLECMVYMGVTTLQQGARIIAQTGRTDIGLVIDPLHLDRAGERPAAVGQLAAGQIACVQLCDAGPRPDPADLTAIITEA